MKYVLSFLTFVVWLGVGFLFLLLEESHLDAGVFFALCTGVCFASILSLFTVVLWADQ